MNELKKIEKQFLKFLKPDRKQDKYIREIEITEELFTYEEAAYIPFRWISYFLAMEDGKPVLYANAVSRMDLNSIYIFDENGHKSYDIFFGDNMDIQKKYQNHRRKVKPFEKMREPNGMIE